MQAKEQVSSEVKSPKRVECNNEDEKRFQVKSGSKLPVLVLPCEAAIRIGLTVPAASPCNNATIYSSFQ